ncbi:hypothetical protein ACFQ9X_18620 [Catenulispora yoronensis]
MAMAMRMAAPASVVVVGRRLRLRRGAAGVLSAGVLSEDDGRVVADAWWGTAAWEAEA